MLLLKRSGRKREHMPSINLIDSFQEFKDAENIDRPTLMKVLEDVFKTLLRKKYLTDENFDVIVNDQTGDLEIFRRREIVEDDMVEDDNLRANRLALLQTLVKEFSTIADFSEIVIEGKESTK